MTENNQCSDSNVILSLVIFRIFFTGCLTEQTFHRPLHTLSTEMYLPFPLPIRLALLLFHVFTQHRNRAEGAKNNAETVQKALDDARKAQAAAEKAIRKAKDDIGLTENRLAQVSLQLQPIFYITVLLHCRKNC